jgi:Ca2+-binding RTX toxin-like protein
MPLNLIFIQPGNYSIEDNGIPGDNISVIKDGNGNVIFTFGHPADALGFTVSTPGVNITVNITDSMGAANFTIGSTDPDPMVGPAQSPDSIVIQNIRTTGTVTLVANGTITEGTHDAAADITAGALIMSAGAGIGVPGNAIETRTGLFEAETTTGGIAISNFGSVQIGGITADVDGLDVVTSGNINFTTVGSIFLTEANSVTAAEVVHGGSTSGNVVLTAIGANADIIGNVDNGAVTVPRGSLTMTAGRDIQLGTTGSDFNNDVITNNTLTFIAGRDILIDGFSDILADNFGLNTGGNLVFTAGRNIGILNVAGTSASVTASGSGGGDAIITTGQGGTLTVNGPGSFALGSTSGDVIIAADRILIDAGSGISSPSGTVIIRPRTNGRVIDLGSGTDGGFAVELSNTELNRIFAATLRIGDGSTGNIDVTGAIAMTSAGNAPDLILRSGTDINFGAGASLSVLDQLTLRAGDNILAAATSVITAVTVDALVDEFGDDGGFGGIGTLATIASPTVTPPVITLQGQAEADRLNGSASGETILGNGGNDILRGFGGNDSLNGGTGSDSMDGGLGDDFLFVDLGSDTVIEAVGEGNDRVFTSASYSLTAGASIETFTTTNSAATTALNLTGNALAQTIYGNAGANTLDGGGGGDLMVGLGGDDFYFIRNSADRAVESAGAGADRVFAAASFILEANSSVEIIGTINEAALTGLSLTGNALAQSIVGNAGNNTLDSGGGGDIMSGLGGNDFYFVRAATDRAVESAAGGSDRVFAALSFTLEAGSSIEILSTTDNNGLTAINLTGNALAQTLYGNAGANTLDGNGGGDEMNGLGGNDFYMIRSASDRAVEVAAAGSDRIFAAVSFALEAGSSVEIIGTVNQGATTAINLTGNAITQTIVGNAGANSLDSGGGNDVMIGLGGDDFYMVRAAGDRAAETAGNGNDRVFAAVNFVLEAGSAVEILSTIFNAAVDPINLTGNELAQSVFGNDGANALDGKGGIDLLTGFAGADTFRFTTALGAGNIDQVSDFQAGVDKIALENAVFTGLAAGALPAGAFVVGAAAADADDRIIYNNATGALLFDADGTGAGAAVQFAVLQGLPVISASDFTVI